MSPEPFKQGLGAGGRAPSPIAVNRMKGHRKRRMFVLALLLLFVAIAVLGTLHWTLRKLAGLAI